MTRRWEAETRAVGTLCRASSLSSRSAPGIRGTRSAMRASKRSLSRTLSSAMPMAAPVASIRKPALRVMGPPTTTSRQASSRRCPSSRKISASISHQKPSVSTRVPSMSSSTACSAEPSAVRVTGAGTVLVMRVPL